MPPRPCLPRLALLLTTASLLACSTTASPPPAAPPPPLPEAAPAPAAFAAATRAEADARAQAKSSSQRMAAVGAAYLMAPAPPLPPPVAADREKYQAPEQNPVRQVSEQPVSTFSIDVDTGSYSNTRRILGEGRLPPADAVRVEEFINYFDYGDAPPRTPETPFAVYTEVAPTPWNANTKLLRIGLKGYQPAGPLPASNLVFLVDVSGSMNEPSKLPLVRSSLKLLARQLTARDRISLVTYASGTEVVLEPTPGDQTAAIEQAIDRLQAGGGTAGAAGITLAYQQAEKAYIKGGNNRVLLATDGDFNLGVTRFESLIDLIKEKRKTGIALTTLGYGGGNYNDHLMEQAADAGDGNHAYIDSLQEAQKVLVAQRAATLLTIARDVKVQVEFNPAQVSEYRLIGYENRALRREDFSNDAVDAGDIGAGHSVTALYEIALVGEGGERNEPLRYGSAPSPTLTAKNAELAFVRLRYKRPDQDQSRLIEQPVRRPDAHQRFAEASASLRLAAAVAAFGQRLRDGRYLEGYDYPQIAALARGASAADAGNNLGDFLQLLGLAQGLSARPPAGAAVNGE
ncbi:VWA domain-containing protein [Stagnimonas aquatica]|uniref:VWA domain-containing protein n=1 Tax=Stagnimonas aquatica TaxID=2689987 RepID=A0A3N0V9W3_9GAMM|nr:VWA domain-containing protein [Stagnimonas aquatica]ROH89566.1 VWA domain-containing protein [Stagnimonas aquatica]